jgi:hypothetical protein
MEFSSKRHSSEIEIKNKFAGPFSREVKANIITKSSNNKLNFKSKNNIFLIEPTTPIPNTINSKKFTLKPTNQILAKFQLTNLSNF